jgi:hypothetical protein
MVMHILTADGLTFMNNATPFSVANDHPKFTKLVELIRKGVLGEDGVTYVPATGDDLQNTYEEERRAIQAAIHAADGQLSDSLTIQDGILRYKGTALDTYVAKKLIEMAREGFVTNNPLVPFIEKLMQNPSRRAVQDLYQFLEFGKNSLTEDGCFIAYKAVRQNWTDIHSGTFDNSIGQVVEVARNEVDEDPDRTCSHGLHVCSFTYLPHFAHADGHIIMVKVNPADVVAIPRDYHNTKMRVCRYEVIEEYKGYYEGKGDILHKSAVYGGGQFGVKFRRNELEEFQILETFDSLVEAAEKYDEVRDEYYEVRVYNTTTDVVIDEHLDESKRVDPNGAYAGSSLVLSGDDEDDRWTVNAYSSEAAYHSDEPDRHEKVDEDDARDTAINLMEDYPIVEILDEDDEVVKTYGYTG